MQRHKAGVLLGTRAVTDLPRAKTPELPSPAVCGNSFPDVGYFTHKILAGAGFYSGPDAFGRGR
jgi:hypothetical protein